MQKPWQEVNR